MAAPDKFFVIESQNWVVRVQELRVEDDFDAISRSVEQLNSANLVEDWIIGIVCHVVCDDGRERVPLERKDSSFDQDLVLGR